MLMFANLGEQACGRIGIQACLGDWGVEDLCECDAKLTRYLVSTQQVIDLLAQSHSQCIRSGSEVKLDPNYL